MEARGLEMKLAESGIQDLKSSNKFGVTIKSINMYNYVSTNNKNEKNLNIKSSLH